MFGMLHERSAVRVATAAVAPMMTRSRASVGAIPGDAWLDPYLVGLLGMLITLVVRRMSPNLGSDSLANVQSRVWASVTGLDATLLGPEVVALSAADDPSFLAGCANAERIADLLRQTPIDDGDHANGQPAFDHDACSSVWTHCVDGYLAGRPAIPRAWL